MESIRRIGRYRIERLLGAGGYATVWLGFDEDLDGLVAIKVLAENWSADPAIRARFVEEARILRRLDDERIVAVHLIDRLEDGRPYFVMEYADRGSLDQRIQAHREAGSRFSITEALGISSEIAECLMVAHDLDVVHRDLKPSNILFRSLTTGSRRGNWRAGLDPSERMLLADFGIARRLEAASGNTITAGTPYYMAPEQARSETSALVDRRSDIYSAAVILYELLCGTLPSSGATGPAFGAEPPADVTELLLSLRGDVPPVVVEIVQRGLAIALDDRWPTAEAWAEALGRASSRVASAGRPRRPSPVSEIDREMARPLRLGVVGRLSSDVAMVVDALREARLPGIEATANPDSAAIGDADAIIMVLGAALDRDQIAEEELARLRQAGFLTCVDTVVVSPEGSSRIVGHPGHMTVPRPAPSAEGEKTPRWEALLETVRTQLGGRRLALKAAAAIRRLESMLSASGTPGQAMENDNVRDRLESLRLQPEVAELGMLDQIRSRQMQLPEDLGRDLERLLSVGSRAARLGLPDTATEGELRLAAEEGAERWRTFVESGRAPYRTRDAARIAAAAYGRLWTGGAEASGSAGSPGVSSAGMP